MPSVLTCAQWCEILLNKEITLQFDLSIFQALYSFPGHKAPASQIGRILGYSGKYSASPLNLEIGRYAKRIAKYYDVDFSIRSNREYKYWDLFFDGWDEEPLFIWQLSPELKSALERTDLTGEIFYPGEIRKNLQEVLTEGLQKTIVVNSYERNPEARRRCIDFWKPVCSVCSFDFEKTYGDIGKGFIHVHHVTPLSDIKKVYQVDPVNDLRPVCPNCHAMLHKTDPPFTVEQLKSILNLRHI